ncbi:hypothetical protein [Streptomyces sp. NPDC058614]|uniref:hypothetical protein n=1 Tax=Streptomyces sp. NPDC058614 TaxID=3346557 RepID=UPI0036461ECC
MDREGGAETTSFHSWDRVKHEVFEAEELDEISAAARRMVAEEGGQQLADCQGNSV